MQDGIIETIPAAAGAGTYSGGSVSTAASALAAAKKGGKYELVLYQKVSIGSGAGSANPWLQELPDPISKASWDNYAMISMSTAKELLGLTLAIRITKKRIMITNIIRKNR